MGKNIKMVTVCSSCLRASCWQGIFYCEDYRNAGTVERTLEDLKHLNLEHEDYINKHAESECE